MRLDDDAGSRMSAARRFLALGVALSTMVVGLAVPTLAQAATSPPTAAVVPAADPVPGQYIVTLEGGTAPAEVPGEAEQLADRYDAGVLDVYDTALVGFSARMSADDAQRLAADPRCRARRAGRLRAGLRDPVDSGRSLGPRPHRPARPARERVVHVLDHRRQRACVRARHRPVPVPQRLRRSRRPRHRFRRRRSPGRLQRPRDPCHGHARGNDVRRRQGSAHRAGARARLRWAGHVLERDRRRELGDAERDPAGSGQHEPGRHPFPDAGQRDRRLDQLTRHLHGRRGQQP